MAAIAGPLRITTEPKELIIRSRPVPAFEHWLQEFGFSVACIGEHCSLCARHHRKQVLWLCVEPVFQAGVYWVMKVPHADEPTRAWFQHRGKTIVGLQVAIRWQDTRKKEGINIQVHGQREVAEIPITNYVAAIGVKAYWEVCGSNPQLAVLDGDLNDQAPAVERLA